MTDREAKVIDPKVEAQITPELLQLIEGKSNEGRITCAVLRQVAQDLGLPYQVAGAAADSVGVKVQSCELGCF